LGKNGRSEFTGGILEDVAMSEIHTPRKNVTHLDAVGLPLLENFQQLCRRSTQSAGQDRTGCPFHKVKSKLQETGVKQSLQRTMLGWLLFGQGERHVTAEKLYEEARQARIPVSQASVYNTLHLFTKVGLLREIAQFGSKSWYDTDVSSHYHFYVGELDEVFDIPAACLERAPSLQAPDGMEIVTVDVIVNLRPAQAD
jgi:Fur family iron response transcriptional regulator